MKKVMIIAAVIALAAGTAFGAESVNKSVTLHSNGTKVEAKEMVSSNGEIRRAERLENIYTAQGQKKDSVWRWFGKFLPAKEKATSRRMTLTEESGTTGKIVITEVAADGRVAKAEGVYQRY